MKRLSVVKYLFYSLLLLMPFSCITGKMEINSPFKLVLLGGGDNGTKSSPLSDDIKRIDILIYGSSGKLISHKSFTSESGIIITPPEGNITIVAIANKESIKTDEIQSLSLIKEACSYDKTGINGYPIYTGEVSFNNNGQGGDIFIELNRLTAKITFVFDKSGLNPDVSLTVKSVEIINSPSKCLYLSPNKLINGDATENLIMYGPEPASHESATPFYLFENLQGTHSISVGQTSKHPGGITELCTRAIITADYSSPSKSGEVKFIYFPGENTTDNFDIPRGSHLRETIYFEGTSISEVSQRIDKSGLTSKSYAITVSASPEDGGSVSGGGLYEYGSLPSLHATESNGFRFAGWSPQPAPVTKEMHYTALFEITEQTVLPVSLTLNYANLDLSEGDEFRLEYNIEPENTTDKRVFWSSSASEVATVDQNGNIKAKSYGTSIIKATSLSGEKSDQCTVKVFRKVNICPEKYISYTYDNLSGAITGASVSLFLRVQTPTPSDMVIVRPLIPYVTVSAVCRYNINGFEYTDPLLLSLSFTNNNDTPWLFTEGSSFTIYITENGDESAILSAIDSIKIDVTPGMAYVGNYCAVWN